MRDELRDVWGLATANSWQVDAIWLLSRAAHASRLLLVRKTGDGKSAVVFGAASLLRGVSLVVVPLLGLGVDLCARVNGPAARARHVVAFHLDELARPAQRKLARCLRQIAAAGDAAGATLLLICSPQALGPEKRWRPLVESLAAGGVLRLLAVDEADKILTAGRAFRTKFAQFAQLATALTRTHRLSLPLVA